MKRFVLDCSFTMGWCFEDEENALGNQILESLKRREKEGIVPSLWYFEVVNVLGVAEKRKRISPIESFHFLDLLLTLPISVDERMQDLKDLLLLSRTYDLSAYDAAYLDLSLKEQIPLATLDKQLKKAANKARIPLWET